jgi:hypothetical protein
MKAIVWIAFVVLQAEAQAKCENKASNCAEMREQGRCEQVSVFLRLFFGRVYTGFGVDCREILGIFFETFYRQILHVFR